MKIGINAGILNNKITGIGRYLISLLKQFEENEQHEFFLYFPQRVNFDNQTFTQNMTIRHSHFPTGVGKKLWEQTVLPLWAMKDKLDVLWSPSHHLPVCLPKTICRVVTIHDIVWKKYPETMPWWNRMSEALLMPMALKVADHIISVSNSTSDDIVNLWPTTADKISVIYPGVAELKKTNSFDTYFKKIRPYILFVGTLEPRKNLSLLIQAYQALPDKLITEYDLVIVGGEGWGELGLPDVKRNNLPGKLCFMGYVSDEKLGLLYENATLFVMPSLYEGFGLPLLEAMSHGVPVVTSDCSSMPEVVGECGYLINPFDVDSISKGIEEVLTNKSLYDKLKSCSQARADHFSWKQAKEEFLILFEEEHKKHGCF